MLKEAPFFLLFLVAITALPTKAETPTGGANTQGTQSQITSGERTSETTTIGLTPNQIRDLAKAAGANAIRPDQVTSLSKRLGVAPGALVQFLGILGKQNIPPERLEAKLLELISNFKDLQERISNIRKALDQGLAVDDLKGRATKALAAGSFDEADRLLGQAVQAVPSRRLDQITEQQEKHSDYTRSLIAELRAERGALARARLRYGEAAEKFGEAAASAPAAKRGSYLKLQASALYAQGDEFGDNAALRDSITMHRRALQELSRDVVPLDWAAAENDLGNSLAALGGRESGTIHLQEAILAYRLALEERTRERVPLHWAQSQNDLGDALVALGERESGTAHLEEAVAAYRLALEERTQERVPLDWARTANRLAKTLAEIEERKNSEALGRIKSWASHLTGQDILALIISLVVFLWMTTLLILYWLNPAQLVRLHEAFPTPAEPNEVSRIFEKISLGSAAIAGWVAKILILYLGTSSRALNAWVADRVDVARALYTARPTVLDRRIALDLPARIDGVRYNDPWSEIQRLLSQNAPLAMLISGPGGAGKTSLACRIGRASLATTDQRTVGQHPMLPLLIEADVPEETTKSDCLYSYLAGVLRSALNESQPISSALTRALLKSGRVLIIVDGMSERSAVTRQAFNPQKQGFEINRFIVTSRESEFAGMSNIVETETIPTGELFDFIERYLCEMAKSNEGKVPSEDRILDACGDLKRLLGNTPCTPLLATMWAREIGAPQEQLARPRGVAGLIDSYIRRLLLPAANGNEALVNRLTKDAAKIAERELGDRYQPGYVTRATALDVIRALDPSDPDKRFSLLEKSRLLVSPSQHSDVVHIVPDPVAEHFVARLRTEELGGNEKGWSVFLRQLRKHDLPVDFMAALAVCAEDEAYGSAVPAPIRQQLKDHTNDREMANAEA